MPVSSDEGKAQALEWIKELDPHLIVDVGPGAGTWPMLYREGYWVGVEIWAPYIEQFGLRDLYDQIAVADIRYFNWDLLGLYEIDLVILGDVLEHMEMALATILVRRLRFHSDAAVLVSVPIRPWEQGPIDGNPYEAHLHHWSDEEVRREFGEPDESWVGPNIGVYLWR